MKCSLEKLLELEQELAHAEKKERDVIARVRDTKGFKDMQFLGLHLKAIDQNLEYKEAHENRKKCDISYIEYESKCKDFLIQQAKDGKKCDFALYNKILGSEEDDSYDYDVEESFAKLFKKEVIKRNKQFLNEIQEEMGHLRKFLKIKDKMKKIDKDLLSQYNELFVNGKATEFPLDDKSYSIPMEELGKKITQIVNEENDKSDEFKSICILMESIFGGFSQ